MTGPARKGGTLSSMTADGNVKIVEEMTLAFESYVAPLFETESIELA